MNTNNATINGFEINKKDLLFDEHFYKKYADGKTIIEFSLKIEASKFNETMQPKYEKLLQELLDDDIQNGENFALEIYDGSTTYPSYEEIIGKTFLKMGHKMEFLNSFFIADILNTVLENYNSKAAKWIIREVLYLNEENGFIIIKGKAQTID